MDAQTYLERLDSVERRLGEHVEHRSGLTEPDPPSGEQWDHGQVWAHLAEFTPYWMDQARDVIDSYEGVPVPFGRTKADPHRIQAIADGRNDPPADHFAAVQSQVDDLRGFVSGLSTENFEAVGLHETIGPMTVHDMMDEFLVGHLEEHLEQLQGLTAS